MHGHTNIKFPIKILYRHSFVLHTPPTASSLIWSFWTPMYEEIMKFLTQFSPSTCYTSPPSCPNNLFAPMFSNALSVFVLSLKSDTEPSPYPGQPRTSIGCLDSSMIISKRCGTKRSCPYKAAAPTFTSSDCEKLRKPEGSTCPSQHSNPAFPEQRQEGASLYPKCFTLRRLRLL